MVTAAPAGYRWTAAAARHGLGLLCLLVVLMLPLTASALGIGSIETRSVAGEVLDARIPLYPSSVDWVEDIEAGLAAESVFDRAGVERVAELDNLRFTVVDDPDGMPFIRVTSDGPIERSFLAFVMEVRWGGGRLLREYTLLLDPPVLLADGPAVPIVQTPRETGSGSLPGRIIARTRDEPAPAAAAEATSGTVDRAAGDAVAAAEAPPTRQVIRNDTLWGIASELSQGEDVSIYQMMVALYRANPDAFIDENMNLLRAGAVLELRPVDAVARLQAAEARNEFVRQVDSWVRSRGPAGDPAMAIARAEAVAGPDQPADLLRVVAAGQLDGDELAPGLGSDAAPVQQLREEVTLLREAEASLESERDELARMNEELRTRIDALERLINFEAAPDAGRLSQSAEESREAAAAAAAQPAVDDGQPPFWADPRVLSAAALAFLFMILLMLLRRRRARDDVQMASLPDDDLTGDGGVGDSADPRRRRSAPQGRDARPATGRSAEMSSRRFWSTFEPAEEADYYFARRQYGRVVDLLRMALLERVDEPRLWLRLLEAQRSADDRAGFVASAERLRRLLGDDSSAYWRSVVRMGQQFVPDHPLFGRPRSGTGVSGRSERPGSDNPERSPVPPQSVIGTAYGTAIGDAQPTTGARSILTWSAVPGDELVSAADVSTAGAAPVPGGSLEGSISGQSPAQRDVLARARRYIQNGDRDMARSLLQGVIERGTRQEQSEARALYQRLP